MIIHYLTIPLTRRIVTHHRRAGDTIMTAVLVNGPVVLDPPGVNLAVEAFYDGA